MQSRPSARSGRFVGHTSAVGEYLLLAQKNAPTRLAPSQSCALAAVSVVVLLLSLAGQALYCFMRPASPFDSVIYVSLLDGGSQQAYRDAGKACAASLPGPHNQCDADGSSYRQIGAYTPAEYQTFLRFYRIKPLYTSLATLLHRALHLSGFVALRIVSALSFFIAGLTIAFWLRHHLSITTSCLSALLIMSFPQVMLIGKFLLPDMFSVAIMLPCLYAILYRTRMLRVQLFLLSLLPLARPDNIILSFMLGAMLLYRTTAGRRQLLLRLAVLFMGCVALNNLLSHATHSLSYTILFNHSFVDFSRPALYPAMRFNLHEYLHTVIAHGLKVIVLFFPVPLFFTGLALSDRTFWRPLRDLVLAATASAFARLLLFPAEEQRYYTWWLVIAALAAAATTGQRVLGHLSRSAAPVPYGERFS
jgi:hypothetical protein